MFKNFQNKNAKPNNKFTIDICDHKHLSANVVMVKKLTLLDI